MRILSIGNFGRSWDGSVCDEVHIADALEGLGHEVVRSQREAAIIFNLSEDYDFILIAQWDGYSANLCPLLRQFKCPIVYWSFDYQAVGQEWHGRLIHECDLYLSKRLSDSNYPNWQWLSQDFAPEFLAEGYYHQKMASEKDIDVLFTGSYLPWATERTEILKAIDREFNLTIHSFTPVAWKSEGLTVVNDSVMDQDLPGLIDRAKINISVDHTIEAGYWSDRNAQIMACGGFVLSRYVPLAETVFRDKIAYFYDTNDCLAKISKYLDDEFTRELMATIGQKYARDNLMVTNRVKDLLTIVEAKL